MKYFYTFCLGFIFAISLVEVVKYTKTDEITKEKLQDCKINFLLGWTSSYLYEQKDYEKYETLSCGVYK